MNLGHSSGSGARHAHKPPRDHVRVAMMKAARRARTGERAVRGVEQRWIGQLTAVSCVSLCHPWECACALEPHYLEEEGQREDSPIRGHGGNMLWVVA